MRRILMSAALALFLFAGQVSAQSASISLARARAIALNSVPNNQGVKSEKLKTEDGVLVYEFDIETPGSGHREVRVDATSGVIVQNKHEEGVVSDAAHRTESAVRTIGDDVSNTADRVFGHDEIARMNLRISEPQARRIALRETHGGTVKDVDLKREHGVIVWDVEVDTPGKGHDDVRIDANTGAVLKLEYHK